MKLNLVFVIQLTKYTFTVSFLTILVIFAILIPSFRALHKSPQSANTFYGLNSCNVTGIQHQPAALFRYFYQRLKKL